MLGASKILIGTALLATAVGCASIETTTRTGRIHEVRFAERMTPATLNTQPGDEIMWVNQRNTPVTVEFLSDALDEVSCARGFNNLLGRLQESTTINPNESASLCLTEVGVVTYNARMESAVAGGQVIQSGTIRVGR